MPKYTATFSDGTVIKRKSPRTYTHAYLSKFTRDNGTIGEIRGFSGSRKLAEKACRGYGTGVNFYSIEIVEVVS